MLDVWNAISLGLLDVLLGWTLALPRELAVVIAAVLTAGIFTWSRRWTTNQDRLRRTAADLRRLKELRTEAKLKGDKDALVRQAGTRVAINMLRLKSEGRPLLVAIVPLLLLGTWAFHRLEFHSPDHLETTEVALYLQTGGTALVSAEGEVLHLVPQPGLHAKNGWVQTVRRVKNTPGIWSRAWAAVTFREPEVEADAVAIWQLKGERSSTPYPLVFRWRDRTYRHEMTFGQREYSPALLVHEDDTITVTIALQQREVQVLGIPGLGPWFPAWIVGYLLVTIPLFFGLKWLLGVY